MFSISCLPKLTFLTFSGGPLTWQTFLGSFYVSANTCQPQTEWHSEVYYLKAPLQGNISRTITDLFLTELLNYGHSIAQLLEDRASQCPYKATLPSPSNSLASLWIFYDSVESHIRGLLTIGKSRQSYSHLLIHLFG